MSKESLYKSYTPPTCTLNIYNPPSFLPLKGQNLAPDYTFELSFDDPRMPSQDLIMLRGDRPLLEKIRTKINQYLDKYLKNLDFEQGELDNDENNDFLIIGNGQLHHLIKTENKQSIQLTHTQFLDFTNALENFYLDFRDSENKIYSPLAPFKTIVGISAIALILVGGFWWYNRTIITQETEEEIENTTESNLPDFPEVEPPTPLDRNSLPPISLPDVPDSLLQRQPLPPPAGEIPLPPDDFPTPPSNESNGSLIPAPPPPNLSGNGNTPNQTSQGNNTSPPPPAELAPPPQPLPRLGSNRPSLPPTPPLQARNPQGNNNNDDNGTPADNNPTSNPSAQEKVKSYFASRWQPPENLTQSIEYRLTITPEGSVSSISPIGQTAGFFIDRTPLPLRGEIIISPLTESEPVRVRVIFSPDGNVNTFRE